MIVAADTKNAWTNQANYGKGVAELMGLEPTTFAVTGRCSNQLRYNSGF